MFPKYLLEFFIMVESLVCRNSDHFIGALDESSMHLEHDSLATVLNALAWLGIVRQK